LVDSVFFVSLQRFRTTPRDQALSSNSSRRRFRPSSSTTATIATRKYEFQGGLRVDDRVGLVVGGGEARIIPDSPEEFADPGGTHAHAGKMRR